MIKVKCKQCNREIEGNSAQVKCCGCPNMTTVNGDKITANNLSDVVMLNYLKQKKNQKILSDKDLEFQESRKKRKIRKLDFEIR